MCKSKSISENAIRRGSASTMLQAKVNLPGETRRPMSTREHILVVDDDKALLQVLELTLSEHGYEVSCATSGLQALRLIFQRQPDLVILDISIPELNGWDVCQRIREMSDIPILILTAYCEQENRIKGLTLGADDYVVKPFDIPELLLRIRAILRRARPALPPAPPPSHRYDDGHLLIDLDAHLVQYDGRPIHLTPHEFDLLACMVRHVGKTLTPDFLLSQVWGLDMPGKANQYIKTYIRYLRRKIEPDPEHPRYILTERGLGYRLARAPGHPPA
jgi:two-component system KDP operon response regulator KdpE